MWLGLLLIAEAFPCGGLVHNDAFFVESQGQEVIFEVQEKGAVTATYRVTYQGDASDFGWVIPIVGSFNAFQEGEDATFDSLRQLTAPHVYTENPPTRIFSCIQENLRNDGGWDDLSSNDVVIAEGFTGDYSYTVLDGAMTEEVSVWLTENQWDLEAPMNAYLGSQGVQWVMISINPNSPSNGYQTHTLPPVAIQYTTDTLTYPARMASIGESSLVRTTLWFIDAQRMDVSGWTQRIQPTWFGSPYDGTEYAYNSALEDIIGGEAAYALTYSDAYEEGWVTRFDTRTLREAHTIDPTFFPVTNDTLGPMRVTLILRELDSWAAFFLPLLGCGFLARRRRNANTGRPTL